MRVLILGLLLVAGAGQAASGLIEPPFVRKWTVLTGDNTKLIAVKDGVIYYHSKNGVAAVDLDSGKEKWHALKGKWMMRGVEQGGKLWVTHGDAKTYYFSVIDAANGKTRFLGTLPDGCASLAADRRGVYRLDERGVVTAVDPDTGKTRWTASLAPNEETRTTLSLLIPTEKALYVGICNVGHFGLDPLTGAVRWKRLDKEISGYTSLEVSGDILVKDKGLARLDSATGKVLWTLAEWRGEVLPLADLLIGCERDTIVALNQSDGKERWRRRIEGSKRTERRRFEPELGVASTEAWISASPYLAVNRSGKLVWSREMPFSAEPLYVDSERLLTSDSTRLLCYGHGEPPPLPIGERDREALARRLAADYELLDESERRQLIELKPYAFKPLLARYLEWSRKNPKEDHFHPFGLHYYRLLNYSPKTLEEAFEPADTAALVEAIQAMGFENGSGGALVSILQTSGNEEAYVNGLISELKKPGRSDGRYSSLLGTVVRSKDRAAAAFMTETLRDAEAPLEWRREAYRHLAGAGSEEGVAAVRAATPRRAPLTPWFLRVKPNDRSDRTPDVRKDEKGRTWVAFQSDVLGNEDDLFIARKVGNSWDRPVFTGVWSDTERRSKSPWKLRGVSFDRIVDGDWINLFPDDPSIRRDTDGDTLTDIVEARLGTNPKKADTDMDGLKDAVDPCPNAAPRLLGDEEKIYAAAVAGHFFGSRERTPALISIEDVKPFELYGYRGPLLWSSDASVAQFSRVYGGGVNLISFDKARKVGKEYRTIEFGSDRRSAQTTISRRSGGLNGEGVEVRLKKIGDEWFVTDMILRRVS